MVYLEIDDLYSKISNNNSSAPSVTDWNFRKQFKVIESIALKYTMIFQWIFWDESFRSRRGRCYVIDVSEVQMIKHTEKHQYRCARHATDNSGVITIQTNFNPMLNL